MMSDSEQPKRLSDRKFGFVFAAAILVVGGVTWLVFDSRPWWAVFIAGIFTTLAVAAPWILMPANRLWMALARRIGEFNNILVLGLFFYIFILPVAVLFRLIGRDSMSRRRDTLASTYFVPVRRQLNAETLNDMF